MFVSSIKTHNLKIIKGLIVKFVKIKIVRNGEKITLKSIMTPKKNLFLIIREYPIRTQKNGKTKIKIKLKNTIQTILKKNIILTYYLN